MDAKPRDCDRASSLDTRFTNGTIAEDGVDCEGGKEEGAAATKELPCPLVLLLLSLQLAGFILALSRQQ